MAETTKKILIVDDEEDSRAFIREALESETLHITEAGDGEEGLRRAREAHPDLMILDVHMPKINGFEVLNEIKKDDATARIPVVMLTAVHEKTGIKFSKDSIREFMNVEPDAYIEKPLDPEKLRQTVASILAVSL